MVVVDNKCDCSMFEPITMNPIEIMYILHRPETFFGWGANSSVLRSRMTGGNDLKSLETHLPDL